uniref:HDC12157 n=1 Tax=Drosophila melanogaster TaxID=7227 RepID=Q6IKL6_DROME|nr:TPA_inf: HDC12157 [Drosophila melanogaster]
MGHPGQPGYMGVRPDPNYSGTYSYQNDGAIIGSSMGVVIILHYLLKRRMISTGSKFDIQMSQEKSDISHMVILCIDAKIQINFGFRAAIETLGELGSVHLLFFLKNDSEFRAQSSEGAVQGQTWSVISASQLLPSTSPFFEAEVRLIKWKISDFGCSGSSIRSQNPSQLNHRHSHPESRKQQCKLTMQPGKNRKHKPEENKGNRDKIKKHARRKLRAKAPSGLAPGQNTYWYSSRNIESLEGRTTPHISHPPPIHPSPTKRRFGPLDKIYI